MSKRSKRRERQTGQRPGAGLFWETAQGFQTLLRGSPPDAARLEAMTREYQQSIRQSPLWPRMVQEHGLAGAEALLQQCRVQTP